ncbi:hypothetical protein O9992_27555 [Vibrio lentus]|nr:hypothetical protein [Vibrio lentus]
MSTEAPILAGYGDAIWIFWIIEDGFQAEGESRPLYVYRST